MKKIYSRDMTFFTMKTKNNERDLLRSWFYGSFSNLYDSDGCASLCATLQDKNSNLKIHESSELKTNISIKVKIFFFSI